MRPHPAARRKLICPAHFTTRHCTLQLATLTAYAPRACYSRLYTVHVLCICCHVVALTPHNSNSLLAPETSRFKTHMARAMRGTVSGRRSCAVRTRLRVSMQHPPVSACKAQDSGKVRYAFSICALSSPALSVSSAMCFSVATWRLSSAHMCCHAALCCAGSSHCSAGWDNLALKLCKSCRHKWTGWSSTGQQIQWSAHSPKQRHAPERLDCGVWGIRRQTSPVHQNL